MPNIQIEARQSSKFYSNAIIGSCSRYGTPNWLPRSARSTDRILCIFLSYCLLPMHSVCHHRCSLFIAWWPVVLNSNHIHHHKPIQAFIIDRLETASTTIPIINIFAKLLTTNKNNRKMKVNQSTQVGIEKFNRRIILHCSFDIENRHYAIAFAWWFVIFTILLSFPYETKIRGFKKVILRLNGMSASNQISTNKQYINPQLAKLN